MLALRGSLIEPALAQRPSSEQSTRSASCHIREDTMKLRVALLSLAVGFAVSAPQAHDTDSQSGPLGKVTFPTSCDPNVQASFERAVVMLHSFWYSAGEQAFRDVLKADPQCAIATWGIASILMSNPLGGQGASPKGAEVAQAAIDEGRRIGAKTERERDYI